MGEPRIEPTYDKCTAQASLQGPGEFTGSSSGPDGCSHSINNANVGIFGQLSTFRIRLRSASLSHLKSDLPPVASRFRIRTDAESLHMEIHYAPTRIVMHPDRVHTCKYAISNFLELVWCYNHQPLFYALKLLKMYRSCSTRNLVLGAADPEEHLSRRIFGRRFHFLSLKRSPRQLLRSFLRKASTFERSRHCSLRVLASPLVGAVRDGPER